VTDNTIMILDEETVREMVYDVRGQKVMLDFDLATIYGYETKAFNRQVKRNIERFPSEFMFQLTREELDDFVRSKFLTSREAPMFTGQSGGSRYLPYAFTEQGIYMLMTVLKGEVAVQQSIMLIRIFKKLKDRYATESLLSTPIETALAIGKHEERISLAEERLDANEKGVERNRKSLASQRKSISVIKAELAAIMGALEDPSAKKTFLFLNGERIEAAEAYRNLYARAQESIIVIDDYVNLKTLSLLKSAKPNVSILIVSDNMAKPKLTEKDLEDFFSDMGNPIRLKPTENKIHDRYIALDYGKENEEVYLCGSSGKDAGSRATTIMKAENPQDFHRLFDLVL